MIKYIIPIIALIIGVIFRPAGEYLLAVIMSKVGDLRPRKISRSWKSHWSFDDPDKKESQEDIIELYQFGTFIRGSGIGENYKYKINAQLKPDGRIHGTWRKIQTGADWYGSLSFMFQLVENQRKGNGLEKAHLGFGLVTGNGIDQINSIGSPPEADAHPIGLKS